MRYFFILITVPFLFTACAKDVDALPPATETGANTFGAKVNGEYWIPQGFGILPTAEILEARYINPTDILINARNFGKTPNETEFEFYIKDISGPGTFLFNQHTAVYPDESASYGYYIKRKFTPEDEWITDASHTGRIVITKLDKENKIISGTFEFQAVSMYNASVTLTVTEGRFDLKML